MKYNYLIVIMMFISSIVLGQSNTGMFMFQIDGNNYTKKSYDKNGNLQGSQILKVGQVDKKVDQYTMTIKAYSYDKNGKMSTGSNTIYKCKPTDKLALMNIFPFADFGKNKTINVESKTSLIFFPTVWETGKKIDNISFSISIKGNSLVAIGTTAKIRITDREITTFDKLKSAYTITSKMQIKVYAFGLLVNTISYSIEEIVNPNKGIIKQYFKEASGDYFKIELQQ